MRDLNLISKKVLNGAVSITHFFASIYVQEGDLVLDATCGNGSDTMLLAQLVGEEGHVYAYDLQKVAIRKAKEKISFVNLSKRVTFINKSHSDLSDISLKEISFALFNLGYLPGGDHSITTLPATTVAAIKSTLEIIKQKGVVLISLYPGHAIGEAESLAVEEYLSKVDQNDYHVWQLKQLNSKELSPYSILIQKL